MTTAIDDGFVQDVQRHQDARNRRLRSGDGWLSLVGRWVLSEGDNDIDIGTATLAGGAVTLKLALGVDGTVDGRALRQHTWAADAPGPGPYLVVGARRYELLRQADRVAVRVRDPQSPALTAFTGLAFYPPNAGARVQARLVGEPGTLTLATGLGAVVEHASPGTLSFTLDGQALTLDPVIEADDPSRLFLIFKDRTNGDTTYGAGRFLYAPLPDASGRVIVDFNKAYNPPCALTEFAACPVCPPQNRLAVKIEAGEKTFHAHGT